MNLALDPEHIDKKSVTPALEAVIGTAPDVRGFNLSFDNLRPLDAELPTMQQKKLKLMQELDNLIYGRDIVVVVAAGNSPKGFSPSMGAGQSFPTDLRFVHRLGEVLEASFLESKIG